MNNKSYDKQIKKAKDMIKHFDYLIEESGKLEIKTEYFKSFVANSTLIKISELKRKEYKKYLKELKSKNIYSYILCDNLKRKIKKSLLKISPRFYFKIKGKR